MKKIGRGFIIALSLLALAGCAQPDGFALQSLPMPGADDENHPAALRDVAQAQPATVGATLNALFSFPETDGR